MSEQGVSAFLDRLTAEDDFRRDVGQTLQGRPDTGAATVEFARDAGLEFTVEEFDEALDERYGGRELSDSELDQASGGASKGALFLSVSHTTSSGTLLAFPDVCLTPVIVPLPTPYPIIGTTSDSGSGGTKSKG